MPRTNDDGRNEKNTLAAALVVDKDVLSAPPRRAD